MEEEHILGRMVENIKVSINLTRNMDSVLTLGKMEENMSANGKIVNDMEEEKSFQLMELRDKEFGRMMLSQIKMKQKIATLNLPIAKYHEQS